MPNSLEQLKVFTTVVADTADFEAMKAYSPTDATTNPSIILAAASLPQYKSLLEKSVHYGKTVGNSLEEKVENAVDMLYVLFGIGILEVVPGRVSIQADPRLSFDKEATIEKALKIVRLFEKDGMTKDRILIKVASTWEGIQAAKVLEQNHGVHCNLTLLFNLAQAVAGAEVGVTMISPFVARVVEWYVANTDKKFYSEDEHPGIISLRNIYNYLKKFGYKTVVMGASLSNIEEVKALAGCDLLTISPKLLEKLAATDEPVSRKLSKESAVKLPLEKIQFTEANFRWQLNEDQMASDALSEGIRKFARDYIKLESTIKSLLM